MTTTVTTISQFPFATLDKNIDVEFPLSVHISESAYSTPITSYDDSSDSESDESFHKGPKNIVQRFHSAKDFFFEKLRLETFHNFCHDHVDKEELAREGFVAIHNGDMVQCVYCNGLLGLWSKGDIVLREHEKYYSNCPNVVSTMANVPKDQKELGKGLEERLKKKTPVRVNRLFTDSKTLDRFSFYSHEAERRRSFNHSYLFSKMPKIDAIVKAGFYSNGVSDCTMCFSCGGGVFNWTPYDDPEEVHARLYHDCRLSKSYREKQKGNNEVKEIESEDTDSDSEDASGKTTFEVKSEWFANLELANAMVGRWKLEFICDAFKHKFDKYGTLPANKNEALDAIFDYEEFLED